MEQKAQTGGRQALRGSHIGFAQPVELFEKSEVPVFENSEGMALPRGSNWQCSVDVAEALQAAIAFSVLPFPPQIHLPSLIYVPCLA